MILVDNDWIPLDQIKPEHKEIQEQVALVIELMASLCLVSFSSPHCINFIKILEPKHRNYCSCWQAY